MKLCLSKGSIQWKKNEVNMEVIDNNQDLREELKNFKKYQLELNKRFLKIDHCLEELLNRIQELEDNKTILSELD